MVGLLRSLFLAVRINAYLAVRINAYLWPRPLVYSGLAVLLACIVYLLCFNRI